MYRTYDKYKDKGVMFYSAASPRDSQQVIDAGAAELLVSYHYLRQRKRAFTEEIIPQIFNADGLFMTDSGGFSFITGEEKEEYYTEKFWQPYLEEYVQFLSDYSKFIYVAANLDLDRYLGRDKIDKWNDKYFKPLEKKMNIVYIVQRDWDRKYNDYRGLKRLKEYMDEHEYIGCNQTMKESSGIIYAQAKIRKKRIHGFAWTSLTLLHNQPLFSIDSSTWLSGQRYGTTFQYDGKNFRAHEKYKKHLRKGSKIFCRDHGLDYDGLIADKQYPVTAFNAYNWRGFRDEFVKIANIKLHNKPVAYYDKK